MPEKNDTNEINESNETSSPEQKQDSKTEKVGDILHRNRVVKRISLETVAKDLKLNIEYIKAIESNNFHLLPAQPYVRVYLRSIANYLMLDPEEILKKFFKDRGIKDTEESNKESERIKINVQNDVNKSSLSRYLLIIGIIILGVLIFAVGNKMGWIKTSSSEETTTSSDISSEIDEEELEAFESSDSLDTLTEKSTEDSIMGLDSLNTETKNDTPKDTLKFVVQAIKDSAWVQIFYDGKSWKNFVRVNHPRVFYATDSLNVHVGKNSCLKYFLNGKKIRVKGTDVKCFRVDSKEIEMWKMSKWRSVFKGRL
jgi:cytoskeletal protein RodZ